MKPFSYSGNKILSAVCLLLIILSVFTACNQKNSSEDFEDPTNTSAFDAAYKENSTDSTFAFEEEDLDLPAKENENQTDSTQVTKAQMQTSQNSPTESTTKNDGQNNPSLPPKADSQTGEWGASVNNSQKK